MNQIILAIKLDYEVKILVGEINDIQENTNKTLFDEYELRDKIIVEDYKVPTQKAKRILRASWLLLSNFFLLPLFINYYTASKQNGLESVYEFFYYKNFRCFDVIHVQFGTNKHPIDIFKKIGYIKSRLVVSFHGHDLYFPLNNRIPNNGYYNILFDAADYLIANTFFLKEKLLKINAPEEKIKIIPVAVDTSIFTPNKFDDKNSDVIRIISVGRLEIFKGHQFGIKCISQLVKKGYNIQYSIIGEGSQKEILESLIQKYGLKKSVVLLGRKSQVEISKILPTQDIFLMTSITDPNYGVESQGLVTAEAQACGLPVVALDTGGVKYTLIDGKTGYLCKEKDLEFFVEKVEELILNEALRYRIGLNARHFIEEGYSENSVINKWRKLYG